MVNIPILTVSQNSLQKQGSLPFKKEESIKIELAQIFKENIRQIHKTKCFKFNF